MMRYGSLCLVLFTVACGPSNYSSSEVLGQSPKTTDANDFDPALTSQSPIAQSKDFPLHADAALTPGIRCQHADEVRYPEKIAYCERNVSSSTKRSVIKEYDDKLGYNIENLDRNLCCTRPRIA